MKNCTMCGKEFDEAIPHSMYAEAGEWLAGEVWKDSGELCPLFGINVRRAFAAG